MDKIYLVRKIVSGNCIVVDTYDNYNEASAHCGDLREMDEDHYYFVDTRSILSKHSKIQEDFSIEGWD